MRRSARSRVSPRAPCGITKRWASCRASAAAPALPVAVAVLAEGVALNYETLAGHCRKHLAGFKIPRRLILRATLPRNPSGKVLKRSLRDEFTSETLGDV